MNAPELPPLPCPFCGDTSISVRDGSSFRWRVAFCTGCDAQAGEVRAQTSGPGTPDEWERKAAANAIAEWNKRHGGEVDGGEVDRLRAALLQCARMAEALKRPCGEDPESAQAIRNGQYANIATCAHIALGTISGPPLTPGSEIDRCLAQIEEIGRFCDATYAAQEWRPIETAPKDGTEIIVGCDVASVWITRGARWVADGEWPDDKDGDYEGWWSYSSSVSQERLYGLWAPTHWIPMPYLTKASAR